MKIAILILNWNGKKLLKEFLPSIVKYAKNSASIYVVDNASTDDSVLFLQNEFPDVKVLQLSQNFGYAEGYNRALQQIDEAYAILLNNDVAFKSDVATPLLNLFETNQQISAIQPKILDYKKPDYFEYAGAAGGFIDWFAYPFCRGRVFSAKQRLTTRGLVLMPRGCGLASFCYTFAGLCAYSQGIFSLNTDCEQGRHGDQHQAII